MASLSTDRLCACFLSRLLTVVLPLSPSVCRVGLSLSLSSLGSVCPSLTLHHCGGMKTWSIILYTHYWLSPLPPSSSCLVLFLSSFSLPLSLPISLSVCLSLSLCVLPFTVSAFVSVCLSVSLSLSLSLSHPLHPCHNGID